MTRSIATITTTVQVSLTVVDEAKFAAAYEDWSKNRAVQARPNRKAFFSSLATLAAEGNEAPAKNAGCSIYWLGEKRQLKCNLFNVNN